MSENEYEFIMEQYRHDYKGIERALNEDSQEPYMSRELRNFLTKLLVNDD